MAPQKKYFCCKVNFIFELIIYPPKSALLAEDIVTKSEQSSYLVVKIIGFFFIIYSLTKERVGVKTVPS